MYYTRWLWEELRGPIPPGLYACHACDNRNCINIDHLFLDTPSGNTLDAYEKGRMPRIPLPQGEAHPQAKVNNLKVLEIRKRFADGENPMKFGKDYGIAKNTCWAIANRATWKHI